MKKFKCEHCEKIEKRQIDLVVYHRGCRLKNAFPNCYEKKDGLLFFDVKKMFKDRK